MSQSIKLLDIEDELPENLDDSMLMLFLEEKDFFVQPARTGGEAIKYLKSQEFDLILLDMMLPPGDLNDKESIELQSVSRLYVGISILRKIRSGEFESNGTSKDVPVLVISAITGEKRWKDLNELIGANSDYLTKPCSPEDQIDKIESLLALSSHKSRDESSEILKKPFAFVLMPFHDSFQDIYLSGIKLACEDMGLQCERVDEQIFDESILQRIYKQISLADIVIADMSSRNANVFYEVGYAHALKKRVILLMNNSDDIPFDLKHHPHIIYQGKSYMLREKLSNVLKHHFPVK